MTINNTWEQIPKQQKRKYSNWQTNHIKKIYKKWQNHKC